MCNTSNGKLQNYRISYNPEKYQEFDFPVVLLEDMAGLKVHDPEPEQYILVAIKEYCKTRELNFTGILPWIEQSMADFQINLHVVSDISQFSAGNYIQLKPGDFNDEPHIFLISEGGADGVLYITLNQADFWGKLIECYSLCMNRGSFKRKLFKPIWNSYINTMLANWDGEDLETVHTNFWNYQMEEANWESLSDSVL